ncbi:MAG: orotidine-5'-phosphate decarboxylase [Bacteroidales bacterium]|jgi:orotidine-5'-phosphate decarboxylase|nr:orotidine-5'-phosphate decarboxylase [Bacteroidales bacterium]MDD2687211.1 orotidine-5'-phosphate decarboxylase [Bacteroidales bacterium]MDD3331261.1 orotidine-5'-phosphate decarboxylase [Bacteroidales bacterium]MDD3691114.1 orotidine-5'-phosphate decarboxylase [Bacteroidales bacterium]MDD4044782.1 orotidine-5'-phosphate decarboxylase [Bacteroidales bacterium]
MNKEELIAAICQKKSFLCVGLDSDLSKIPSHLLAEEDPIFAFNKAIIDATLPYAVAYKPNLAFYETQGWKGLQSLEKTVRYINSKKEKVFLIADAKRGDIGNTSTQYALSFFGHSDDSYNFDAVTVAPYMGEDSVSPFLAFKNKWVVLLALTSNKGASDFQLLNYRGKRLFEHVLETSQKWGNDGNMMYVVGATQAEMLEVIRKIVPHHFLLIPGVGAQGGSLETVVKYGMNKDCGLLVNASRSIIYASKDRNFAERAAHEAAAIQKEMALYV